MSKATSGQFSSLNIADVTTWKSQAQSRKVAISSARLVLAGPFRAMTEDALTKMIEEKGGRIHKKMGAQTTAVLTGALVGERREMSRKDRTAQRAKAAGLAVLSEQEVLSWFGRDLPIAHDSSSRTVWIQADSTSIFAVLRLAAKLHADTFVSGPVSDALTAKLGDWKAMGRVWDCAEREQWGAAWDAIQHCDAPTWLTLYQLCSLNDPAGLNRASRWRLGVFCLQLIMPTQWRRFLLDEVRVSGRSCPSAVSMLVDLATCGTLQAVEIVWRELCRGSEGYEAVQNGRAAAVYSDADLPALQEVLNDMLKRGVLAPQINLTGPILSVVLGRAPSLPTLKA
jgi:hypothetical protein